jgi:adenosylcobinamide-phosphate synthase
VTAPRLAIAYALDLLVGDPEWFPHPVRGFGWLTGTGERFLRPFTSGPASEMLAGATLTISVASVGWALGRPKSFAWQVLIAWTALATRSLLDEARAVIRALQADDLDLARRQLARIVGRDTAHLDATEISRAVIETLASCAMSYKAINTLDSMIGHLEPPYRYFGRSAARLDDGVSFIPARLTALCIVAAATFRGLDAAAARRIWLRDGDLHASPNAGQSEAAIAGALGVRLGGPSSYDGVPHDAPVLHANGRPASLDDAKSALSLIALVSGIAFGAALLLVAVRRRK